MEQIMDVTQDIRETELLHDVAQQLVLRMPPEWDTEILMGVGRSALGEAVASYDAERHQDFETYARICIRRAMLDAMRVRRANTSPGGQLSARARTFSFL